MAMMGKVTQKRAGVFWVRMKFGTQDPLSTKSSPKHLRYSHHSKQGR